MGGAMRGGTAVVYVISCRRLGLLKIGVSEDAGKRLRELQVGSPLELTLEFERVLSDRGDAVAVCEELYRRFAPRRVRGGWYRLTLEEVRHGFGRRATAEAPERARAAKAAEAAAEESRLARLRDKRLGKRTEKQLAYERRRRQERTRMQKRAARLLGEGLTQEQAAAAVGVTSRTLRNWKAAPAFRRERERAQQRGPSTRPRIAKGPVRRGADERQRERAPAPPAQQQPSVEAEENRPSGFRWVGPVPLWGDSDGWPRTAEEHAQRNAHYSARRDLSDTDRLDYNTVVQFGRQTAAERRAVSQEKTRSRDLARAKRTASRDP
jgi:Meiotically up-regulated gene 113